MNPTYDFSGQVALAGLITERRRAPDQQRADFHLTDADAMEAEPLERAA